MSKKVLYGFYIALLILYWLDNHNFIEKSQKLKSPWKSAHREGLIQISPL